MLDYIDLDDLEEVYGKRPRLRLIYRKENDISLKNIKILGLVGRGKNFPAKNHLFFSRQNFQNFLLVRMNIFL